MADNEIDEQVDGSQDDLLTDEDVSEEKKKGLSKPLLIKIAIGLISTLLIAGGAYFFLMTGDEPQLEEELVESEAVSDENMTDDNMGDSATESTIDVDNLIEVSESEQPQEQMEEQSEPVKEMTEQEPSSNPVTDTQDTTSEQDLMQIREDVKALQEENLRLKQQMGELGAPQSLKPSEEGARKDELMRIEPITEYYSDSYEEGSRDYPYVRKPKEEVIPDPKWGD
ncbi:MAG: hypothetical protein GQ475_04150 [Methylococcaceae bacterium]|nr:hypothetical protein [Methylococcaceae bacterium]